MSVHRRTRIVLLLCPLLTPLLVGTAQARPPTDRQDAVAVRSGRVAATYLSLDQSMVLAQLGNVLTGDLHRAFGSYGQNERRLRPVIGQEVFSAHA